MKNLISYNPTLAGVNHKNTFAPPTSNLIFDDKSVLGADPTEGYIGLQILRDIVFLNNST